MATLSTLLVNGDSVNGPRNWLSTDQDAVDIDEGIASADALYARGVNKTTNNDTSFLLSATNSDLSNVDTLSFRIRYFRRSDTDDTVGLNIRIVTEATGSVLAAADSGGTFQTAVAAGRDGATSIPGAGDFITGSVTAFTYVNTAATKSNWDDARIELRQIYNSIMGADTSAIFYVDTLEITGTYTQVAAPHHLLPYRPSRAHIMRAVI